jgi:hypothetical protein
MFTGKLTPRSNNIVDSMRFSGAFGQPDGFGSVLDVIVNKAGEACFTLHYEERMWSVTLTNEQRNALAKMLSNYQPCLYESYKDATTTIR